MIVSVRMVPSQMLALGASMPEQAGVEIDSIPYDAAIEELVSLALAAHPPSELVETVRLACLRLHDGGSQLRKVRAEGRSAVGARDWRSVVVFEPSEILLRFLAALRATEVIRSYRELPGTPEISA